MAGKLLVTLGLIGLVIIGCVFYIGYRTDEAAALGHITSISQIENMPAIVCTYQLGGYGNGSGGTMYIYHNFLRVDVSDLEIKGYSSNMDAVLGTDGSFLIAPSSVPNGSGQKGAENALNAVISDAPWQCKAWWFPDSGLFTIPDALKL
jgi:hypothetical protein